MKIAIVNSTPTTTAALKEILVNEPNYNVIWSASSGKDAIRHCTEQRPSLILMDLMMPDMDGVEATRRIMQQTPCAILIVTASPATNTSQIFRAMGAGALDVAATPALDGIAADHEALLAKIKTISKLIGYDGSAPSALIKQATEKSGLPHMPMDTLIAIGASTGGPTALAKIFSNFTPAPATAIVVVQHIDQNFADLFANWLAEQLSYPVEIINDGSEITPGKILIAKTNDHLLLDRNLRMHYSKAPQNYSYRPSIDVFFQGVARYWHQKAIGVLLTGMGRDGAQGLLEMRSAGKLTIAQDQSSSVVYGMPRAAAQADAADLILSLDEIGPALQSRAGARRVVQN